MAWSPTTVSAKYDHIVKEGSSVTTFLDYFGLPYRRGAEVRVLFRLGATLAVVIGAMALLEYRWGERGLWIGVPCMLVATMGARILRRRSTQ